MHVEYLKYTVLVIVFKLNHDIPCGIHSKPWNVWIHETVDLFWFAVSFSTLWAIVEMLEMWGYLGWIQTIAPSNTIFHFIETLDQCYYGRESWHEPLLVTSNLWHYHKCSIEPCCRGSKAPKGSTGMIHNYSGKSLEFTFFKITSYNLRFLITSYNLLRAVFIFHWISFILQMTVFWWPFQNLYWISHIYVTHVVF